MLQLFSSEAPAHRQSSARRVPSSINRTALAAGIFESEVLGRGCLHRRAAGRCAVLAAAKGDLKDETPLTNVMV